MALTSIITARPDARPVLQVVHYQRSGGGAITSSPTWTTILTSTWCLATTDQPSVRSDRYAFENVFVYNGGEGSMELFAQGGKKVWKPLQAAFCKAVLDEEVDPADPLRPSFHLDHLLAPTSPCRPIRETASRKHVLLGFAWPRTAAAATLRSRQTPRRHRNDIYRKIERWLKAEKHLGGWKRGAAGDVPCEVPARRSGPPAGTDVRRVGPRFQQP